MTVEVAGADQVDGTSTGMCCPAETKVSVRMALDPRLLGAIRDHIDEARHVLLFLKQHLPQVRRVDDDAIGDEVIAFSLHDPASSMQRRHAFVLPTRDVELGVQCYLRTPLARELFALVLDFDLGHRQSLRQLSTDKLALTALSRFVGGPNHVSAATRHNPSEGVESYRGNRGPHVRHNVLALTWLASDDDFEKAYLDLGFWTAVDEAQPDTVVLAAAFPQRVRRHPRAQGQVVLENQATLGQRLLGADGLTPGLFMRWVRCTFAGDSSRAADALGLGLSTVRGYESGRNPVPGPVLLACRYLETKIIGPALYAGPPPQDELLEIAEGIASLANHCRVAVTLGVSTDGRGFAKEASVVLPGTSAFKEAFEGYAVSVRMTTYAARRLLDAQVTRAVTGTPEELRGVIAEHIRGAWMAWHAEWVGSLREDGCLVDDELAQAATRSGVT